MINDSDFKQQNIYDKLIECFEIIPLEIGKQDCFLLGFYLGFKFLNNESLIEKSDFMNVLKYFSKQHINEKNIKMFKKPNIINFPKFDI